MIHDVGLSGRGKRLQSNNNDDNSSCFSHFLLIFLIISSSGSGDKNDVNDTKKNNDIDSVWVLCFLCQSGGGPQKDLGHVLTMAKLRSSISA